MQHQLHQDVLASLKASYGLVERGEWLRQGKCPSCGKKELYARADKPWVVRCGRLNRCGYNGHVKELFPDLFDKWSERFPVTEDNPTAAADAFLLHGRGLNLLHLRGSYSQEQYFDRERRIGSATVRFPLPGGSWWERLIDQPQRFGEKKANFAYGKSYRGEWWQPPRLTDDAIIAAGELWIVEGIFDAASLGEHGLAAVSAMSCYNYPGAALARLAMACGDRPRPTLIWAFDANRAGRKGIADFVKQAGADGWHCRAALTQEHAQAKPKDWNDLHLLDSEDAPRFDAERLAEYRWNGDVLLAASATEKATLIATRHDLSSFIFDHQTHTYRAHVNHKQVAEQIEQMRADPMTAAMSIQEMRDIALGNAIDVTHIANFKAWPLYFQWNSVADEGGYYFQIEFPSDRPALKGLFSATSITNTADFAKRLAALSPAPVWEGETGDLTRMRRGWVDIPTVISNEIIGYVKEHGAWVFPNHAVKDGRVYALNDEDYFEIGKLSIKLNTSEKFEIDWSGEDYSADWLTDFYHAFGARGLVALAWWSGTAFAEQIRKKLESWPFLQFHGEPAGGKSTLIEQLWRLYGRPDYEGFDPVKGTTAFRARFMAKFGNLPLVMIESDRQDEDRKHVRQFDWDEFKTLYNGGSLRGRGVANGGLDTLELPFRGGIAISQNEAVNASPAIMERIVSQEFSKADHTAGTRAALDRFRERETEALSGFLIYLAKAETRFLAAMFDAYPRRVAELKARKVSNVWRLVHNHAQLMAALDALADVTGMPFETHQDGIKRIGVMLAERHEAISGDHQVVQRFWELVEHLEEKDLDQAAARGESYRDFLNHSRDENIIAIRLVEFEERVRKFHLDMPATADLKKYLKTSKNPKFIGTKPVNSRVTGGSVFAWCFQRQNGKDSSNG